MGEFSEQQTDKKTCPKCGEEKSIEEFYKNKGLRGGRELICKIYRLERIKELRQGKKQGLKTPRASSAPKRSPVPSALSTQVGGSHYQGFKIQPIIFIQKNNLRFIPGNIIKRICRYDQLGGKGVEDLRKIKHEVDILIEMEGLA